MTKIINYFIDQREIANQTGNTILVLKLDYIIRSIAIIYIDDWIEDEE